MDGKIPCVRFCRVVSTIDDEDGDRVKVKLSPEDDSIEDVKDIPYAFPILPKMLHVKPKVGEAVLVLLATSNDGNSQRYYIGPVVSQDHRIYFDPYWMGADSFLRGSFKKPDPAPSMDPDKFGIFPNDDDIVIRGRKNADIQITDDDVRIKAGVKVADKTGNSRKMAFNIKNPSYAKFKYHDTPLEDGTQSTATIVSEKINLLSTSSPTSFNLTDRNHLVSDEELNEIIQKAYRLPYGEVLIDFLNTFVNAFVNHTHNFSMLPPNPAFTQGLISKKADLLDTKKMLSDTVRIN